MIAHVSINVSDFAKSKKFYTEALKPLGYELLKAFPEWSVAGFGANKTPDFWLHGGDFKQAVHIAFKAENKQQVQAFYEAAMKAGGKDNGIPEYQKEYAAGYFGAFVFDPDGNNIEAVFIDPDMK